MLNLVIRMKSGRELNVICEECSISRDGFGNVTNISFRGLKNIRPLILDPDDIELMYEVLPAPIQEDYSAIIEDEPSDSEIPNNCEDEPRTVPLYPMTEGEE